MNSHEHDEGIAHSLWITCVLSHERKATFTFLFDKFQKVKKIVHVRLILTEELPKLNEYS